MALRVCLVTPFAWSRPHDVNEHVAGVAHEETEKFIAEHARNSDAAKRAKKAADKVAAEGGVAAS